MCCKEGAEAPPPIGIGGLAMAPIDGPVDLGAIYSLFMSLRFSNEKKRDMTYHPL